MTDEHEVQDKPDGDIPSQDDWREREDEENARFEDYAEQQQYQGTDFRPAAGWYV